MSALYTALVESESKETLTASLLQHREALRKAEKIFRQQVMYGAGPPVKKAADEAKAVLDTMIFRAAR